jgi:hypothetical protein
MESLVIDIPAEDEKNDNLFLQCREILEGAGCQLEWQRTFFFLTQILNMFSKSGFFFLLMLVQRKNIA